MVDKNTNSEYFDELIAKKLSKEISDTENAELLEWINASEQNRNHYHSVVAIWEGIDFPTIDSEKAWKTLEPKLNDNGGAKVVSLYTRFFPYSVAAAILIALAFVFLFGKNTTEMQEIVAQSENKSFYLSDSSFVEIKQGSKVNFPHKFEKVREITLETGEGFFRIMRNENKPFVVHTQWADVKVLGTAFYVKIENNQLEVWVRHGKVEVSDLSDSQNKIQLVKGESVLFDIKNKSFNTEVNQSNIGFWREESIMFNKLELKKAVEMLNSNFKVNIKIANPELENCKISAEFANNESLEEILKIMEATLGLIVTKNGNEIEITGEKCE